jgi:3-hydroxyisobutyrate dehydrogenase-like beta-hydroxyacid dehydrogenase
MNRFLRFRIAAPVALAVTLMLAPAAQANNADVCQAAKHGHAAFTDDYRYFVTAFTAENTDDAEFGVDLMRDDLRLWRNRVREANPSNPRGVAARGAVLKLISRSRLGVADFSEAVNSQRANDREVALDFFIGGQRILARAAVKVQPRLQAIGCGD